jgi:hypothetical protein
VPAFLRSLPSLTSPFPGLRASYALLHVARTQSLGARTGGRYAVANKASCLRLIAGLTDLDVAGIGA